MTVPHKVSSVLSHCIAVVRWPVLFGLGTAFLLQVGNAITPALKSDQVSIPDLLPPVNTAILALLWWRIGQLEKFKERSEEERGEELEDRRTQDRRKRRSRE